MFDSTNLDFNKKSFKFSEKFNFDSLYLKEKF